MNNRHLRDYQLGKIKNSDEFYTPYSEISFEMKHIKNYLKNKIIYLPCDDPTFSNFWKYFVNNFNNLNLKAVYASYIVQDNEPAYTYIKDKTSIRKIKRSDNGSFDTKASIDLMKKTDIVITNPPFSLLTQHFYPLLQKYAKNYLIIVPITAPFTKHCVRDMLSGRLYFASYNKCTSVKFLTPDGSKKPVAIEWISSFKFDIQQNKLKNNPYHGIYEKVIKQGGGYPLPQIKKWIEQDKIINIDKVIDIPTDYTGIMAVPISFFTKINLNQFAILGGCKPVTPTKILFERLLIQNRLVSRW